MHKIILEPLRNVNTARIFQHMMDLGAKAPVGKYTISLLTIPATAHEGAGY